MHRYSIELTKQFQKDLYLAKKQHKNLDALFEVIDKLSKGETLELKYKDH